METAHLTEGQVRLLADLVDASRKSGERFMMLRTVNAVWLQHPGFPEGTREIVFEDADALRDLGFLGVDEPGNYGGFHFVVTPAGAEASDAPKRDQSRGDGG